MLELPNAILIRPFPSDLAVNARISVPGSKSLTNRSLILAALENGKTKLQGALWAEDTELMVHALRKLGFTIDVSPDTSNPFNRFLDVTGCGGNIPVPQADLDVGTAGTVARFLTAFCALGEGPYKLHGTPRMHERPMEEIFEAVRSLGGKVQDTNGHLPATIWGKIRPGKVSVSDEDSSQFASALVLLKKVLKIEVDCPNPLSPYVDMTYQLLKEWGKPSSTRQIEADASSAAYFFALERIHSNAGTGGRMNISRWSPKSSQLDRLIDDDQKIWTPLWNSHLQDSVFEVSRKTDLGDAAMILVIAAAVCWRRRFHLKEAANMRKQECDRISALAIELRKCGVPVQELPDGLILEHTTQFKKATIHTYNDHRMAMSFAILGTVDVMGDGKPWITIENPSCVRKTFPNFFETLEEVARQSYKSAGVSHVPIVLKIDGKPLFD